MTKVFKRLKLKLGYHYGRKIAKTLDGISAEQVRLVFLEQITNPDIVEKVLTNALELEKKANRLAQLKRRAASVK